MKVKTYYGQYPELPATEKQLNYLRKLGVKEIPEGLTRYAADFMIKEKRRERSKYGGKARYDQYI